ncbi:dynein regulatory complex subunit 5 [Scaptodrosophila lebanonensis]|uniref:Dynein regulatory complex subunit 5 n=1 Tax=Drosophila lebanonensis TaxID=7225 RepID=A0A6J2TH89_DROLE|nr:dynein regulatory complex subunit 5 [Scaptodrosophila lebanonensis]
MDFTYCEFPCTVSLDTFKAYFNPNDVKLPKISGKSLLSSQPGLADAAGSNNNECQTNQVKSLRHLVLDAIVENWSEVPLYEQLPRHEDRNYILSQLDVELPLELLSAHISDDYFWERSFQQRWRSATMQLRGRERPWINIYMERHLQEFIENMQTGDYEPEGNVQTTLDICAAYINQLEINQLQPAPPGSDTNDHIPLDYLLANLPDLQRLRLSYCTKTAGCNYQLGCNQLSSRDIALLAKGLSQCHELRSFCIHNTKLAPYQLRLFAHCLDKGCHHLNALSLMHCAIGDAGIRSFMENCTKESFATLTMLDLTNNRITEEGAYILSRTLQHVPLQHLVLRLNPIQSDGAAAIFNTLQVMPIKVLDLGSCSITESITKLFMLLMCQHKTLLEIDLSNNCLGEDFGKHLLKVLGLNKILEHLDLRNTGMSMDMRHKFKTFLLKNVERKKHEALKKMQREKFMAMMQL